jgi:hypothetical protein
MGWFSSLLGAKDTVEAVGTAVEKTGNALDNLFTSDDERLTHAEIMERINQQPAEWAHQLNMLNAQDSSWFNSGWRPALGWVGAVGMFCFFVPQYLLAAGMWVYACLQAGVLVPYPINADGLWELVAMLLGGGVLRTVEKANGTAKH